MVYRRCFALLRNEAQAEEAMQDVFVKLWQERDALHDGGLTSLLFRMATQVSLNRLRTLRRHPETRSEALLLEIAQAADVDDRTGAASLLDRLFGREPASTRVIATLHYIDGMTLDEVAAEVSLSVSGVRKRLRSLAERAQALCEVEHG